MAHRVNIHEAKTHLSKLVDRAQAGEIEVPDDFNAPLPEEVLAAFEGRG